MGRQSTRGVVPSEGARAERVRVQGPYVHKKLMIRQTIDVIGANLQFTG